MIDYGLYGCADPVFNIVTISLYILIFIMAWLLSRWYYLRKSKRDGK